VDSRIQRDSQVPSLLSLASPVSEEREIIPAPDKVGRKTPTSSNSPSPSKDSKTVDLKERARKLLEQTKREAASPLSGKSILKSGSPEEDERQQQLRERARRLIAEARQGLVTPVSTPTTSSTSTASRASPGATGVALTCSSSSENVDPLANLSAIQRRSCSPSSSPSPSESFQKFLNNGAGKLRKSKTPDREKSPAVMDGLLGAGGGGVGSSSSSSDYLSNELETLEKEQMKIDQQAAVLERKLRRLMENPAGSRHEAEEQQLMQQWFTLVNKKNALIRRQMQLNILEKEDDMAQRCALLEQEIRDILDIEDWQKTEAQKLREKLLLEELVAVVNKRDELVHHLDSQEKAIEDDDLIQRDVHNADLSGQDRGCIIQ